MLPNEKLVLGVYRSVDLANRAPGCIIDPYLTEEGHWLKSKPMSITSLHNPSARQK